MSGSRIVTVAIAARNAGDFISDALSSIEASASSLFNHETLVADGGSQDDTIALARKFANTRIVSVSDTGIYRRHESCHRGSDRQIHFDPQRR